MRRYRSPVREPSRRPESADPRRGATRTPGEHPRRAWSGAAERTGEGLRPRGAVAICAPSKGGTEEEEGARAPTAAGGHDQARGGARESQEAPPPSGRISGSGSTETAAANSFTIVGAAAPNPRHGHTCASAQRCVTGQTRGVSCRPAWVWGPEPPERAPARGGETLVWFPAGLDSSWSLPQTANPPPPGCPGNSGWGENRGLEPPKAELDSGR